MKTFKKLFAFSAIFALLATMLPTYAFAATYAEELSEAHAYALDKGITNKSSIETADMYGNLTRVAMAKMMANYVLDLGLQELDTTKTCAFTDVSEALDADYENGVTKACQLGLMQGPGGKDIFNPNGIVTRAEFGTVLSRALYGDEFNNEDGVWYQLHLNKLNTTTPPIMKDISNPNAKEARGNVMLMMMRSDPAAGTATAGCTAEELLACITADDYDACIAACSDEDAEPVEVKAGDLRVSLNSSTAANGTQVPMVGIVNFAMVDFKASSSDISLKTIELSKVGLASIPTTTRVWFEKNGVRVSGKAAFTSEGKAIISFAPAFVVKSSSTETLDLYVDLNTTAGQDFQFQSTNMSTTAQNVNGDFTTPTLRTANYTVAPIDVTSASIGGTSTVSDNGMEIGAFKIENNNVQPDTRDVMFKSITLRQDGNGSLSNLSRIILERNGEVVASNPIINGRDVTFSVMDTVKNATTATYYVKAIVDNVDNQAGDTYQFTIRNTSDVNASEILNGFRSTVTLATLTTALSLQTYTIQGGDLTFSRDSSVALSTNYAAGTTDVVLMKGTISTKAPVTLEDPTIAFTQNATNLLDMFSVIYLQVGSSMFSYSPVAGDTVASFLGTATITSSATVKMYGTLKDTATATKYVKFDDLRLSSFNRVEYVSNGNTVGSAVGTIAGVTVTVEDTALNVTRVDGLGDATIAKGMSNFTVYKLNLSSNQGNGVKVSRATFDITNTDTQVAQISTITLETYTGGATYAATVNGSVYSVAGATDINTTAAALAALINANTAVSASAVTNVITVTADVAGTAFTVTAPTNVVVATPTPNYNADKQLNNVFLTLYVNGVAKQTKTVQGATVMFDGFSETITSNNTVTLEVKANFTEAFDQGKFKVQLSATPNGLLAVDALTSNAVTTYNNPAGATFTIGSAKGVLSATDANPLRQLFLSPSTDNKLVAFKITARNDNIKLYNLTVAGSNLDKFSNFRLVNTSGDVIATATTATASALTFTNISNAPTIVKDASNVYYIIANANSNTTLAALSLTVTEAGTDVRASNGTTVAVDLTDSADVLARAHGLSENTMVVAKAANAGKLLTTSALRFTVTAAGKDTITLTNVSLNNLLAGYTTTGTKVKIYKDSIAAGNLAYDGVTGDLDGANDDNVFVLVGNNTVDAGSTVTYIVALEDTVINAGSNSQDWSVSLSNVVFNGGLDANLYNNVGSFPLTEVK